MFVFCAIVAAREATSCASGCGVVTITASARGSSWPSEIETSPVPGGMSTRSRSSSPQCTSERNCSSARWSIGPRHITGALSSRKKPIDISFRSCFTGGTIILSTSTGFWGIAEHVRDRVAVDVGVEDARAVAEAARTRRRGSRSATTCRRRPCRSRPRARASSGRPRCPSSAPRRRRAASPSAPRFSSGLITSKPSRTRSTPATCPTCSTTWFWKLSRSGQPATVSAIVTETSPPSISTDAHHVELGHRPPELRVDDVLERLQDLVAGRLHAAEPSR